MPRGLCTASLTDAAGDAERSYTRTDDVFEWGELAPGRYRLRLLVDDVPVHEPVVLDLTGEKNTWPRDGSPLDLRRSARAVHVTVVAADGGAPEWSVCWLLPLDASISPDDRGAFRRLAENWYVPRPHPAELAVAAEGCVPVRIAAPTEDTVVRLQRCTTLRVHTAQDAGARTVVRVVEDAVRDPWLRELDESNQHGTHESGPDEEPLELTFAPGTVVEVLVERGGIAGSPQRVAIGLTTVEVTAR